MPEPTPQTAPYWDAAKRGELMVQRCRACDRFYFYPRVCCRYCSSEKVEWDGVSGRARLVSYVIEQRVVLGSVIGSPIIAIVELDEGPRLMTNIIGVEPDSAALPLDLRLEVCFAEVGDMVLPVFKPAGDLG